MPKQSDMIHYCWNCKQNFLLNDDRLPYINDQNYTICDPCYYDRSRKFAFNKPEHYHQHEIDTIEFLKRGFPPEMFIGFCVGNIVKYTQRANYKNGKEDYAKAVDYAMRLVDWINEKDLGK